MRLLPVVREGRPHLLFHPDQAVCSRHPPQWCLSLLTSPDSSVVSWPVVCPHFSSVHSHCSHTKGDPCHLTDLFLLKSLYLSCQHSRHARCHTTQLWSHWGHNSATACRPLNLPVCSLCWVHKCRLFGEAPSHADFLEKGKGLFLWCCTVDIHTFMCTCLKWTPFRPVCYQVLLPIVLFLPAWPTTSSDDCWPSFPSPVIPHVKFFLPNWSAC